ncbi:MAG TPA: RAxF-45 family protein [Bacilli bacterium]|nr:RAxF-45 family protein [Bacilli bacterium]
MQREVVCCNDRLSQLPLAMFGIVHEFAFNGTTMPFFTQSNARQAKRLLP